MPKKKNDGNLRILARVRKIMPWEPSERSVTLEKNILTNVSEKGKANNYAFTEVFGEDNSNEDVFVSQCQSMCEAVLQGFNAVLVAYGQTGAGKTHTLLGKPKHDPPVKGVFPLILEYLANQPSVKKLELSACEAYGTNAAKIENYDLYNKKNGGPWNKKRGTTMMDPELSSRVTVKNGLDGHGKIIRAHGASHFAATGKNPESSRGHIAFVARVTQDAGAGMTQTSNFVVVDLAGSEGETAFTDEWKASVTGEQLMARRLEAGCINTGLTQLQMIFKELRQRGKLSNMVGTGLRRLLHPYINVNTAITVLFAISPSKTNAKATESTLKFAVQAALVKVEPKKVEKLVNYQDIIKLCQAQIQTLRKDNKQLKRERDKYRNKLTMMPSGDTTQLPPLAARADGDTGPASSSRESRINSLSSPIPISPLMMAEEPEMPPEDPNTVEEEYTQRLNGIFGEHKPESLPKVPSLLEKYSEGLHTFYEKVCVKYGVEPLPEYVPQVVKLDGFWVGQRVETPKGPGKIESFVVGLQKAKVALDAGGSKAFKTKDLSKEKPKPRAMPKPALPALPMTPVTEVYRMRLRLLYNDRDQARLGMVDAELAENKDNLPAFYATTCQKFGVTPLAEFKMGDGQAEMRAGANAEAAALAAAQKAARSDVGEFSVSADAIAALEKAHDTAVVGLRTQLEEAQAEINRLKDELTAKSADLDTEMDRQMQLGFGTMSVASEDAGGGMGMIDDFLAAMEQQEAEQQAEEDERRAVVARAADEEFPEEEAVSPSQDQDDEKKPSSAPPQEEEEEEDLSIPEFIRVRTRIRKAKARAANQKQQDEKVEDGPDAADPGMFEVDEKVMIKGDAMPNGWPTAGTVEERAEAGKGKFLYVVQDDYNNRHETVPGRSLRSIDNDDKLEMLPDEQMLAIDKQSLVSWIEYLISKYRDHEVLADNIKENQRAVLVHLICGSEFESVYQYFAQQKMLPKLTRGEKRTLKKMGRNPARDALAKAAKPRLKGALSRRE